MGEVIRLIVIQSDSQARGSATKHAPPKGGAVYCRLESDEVGLCAEGYTAEGELLGWCGPGSAYG